MPVMSFFSNIPETMDGFGGSIGEMRDLFSVYEVPYGSPEDFAGLAPRLTSDGAFQTDFSVLTKSIGQRSDGSLTLKIMLTIVAIAIGGPQVEELESESAVALSVVVAFLAGVGGWKEAGSSLRSRGGSGVKRLNLETPGATEAIRVAWPDSSAMDANEVAEAEALERTLSQKRTDDPREALASFHSSPLLQDALSRLELSALELKLHLDSIDSRMERMEPHLDEITARMSTVNQERRAKAQPAASLPMQRYSQRKPLPGQVPEEPMQTLARHPAVESVTAPKVFEPQSVQGSLPKFIPSVEVATQPAAAYASDREALPGELATAMTVLEHAVSTQSGRPFEARARRMPSLSSVPALYEEWRRALPIAPGLRPVRREVSVGSESPVELIDTKHPLAHMGWVSTFGVALFLVAIFWGLVLRGGQGRTAGATASEASAQPVPVGSMATSANQVGQAGRIKAKMSRTMPEHPSVASSKPKPGKPEEKTSLESHSNTEMQKVETPVAGRDNAVLARETQQVDLGRALEPLRIANVPVTKTEARSPLPQVASTPPVEMALGGTPVISRAVSGASNTGASHSKVPIFVVYQQLAGHALSANPPNYPSSARFFRLEGNVVVEAVISPSGIVESVVPVSGPKMLQDAAVEAVKRWKYQPYLVAGQAVPVRTRVNFHFNPHP